MDQLYDVMPLVEGESLRQRLDREGALPLTEALRIAREVAEALAYAHRAGVVHRDIKPENVMQSDGLPVVTDFEIARAAAMAGQERLTRTGLSIGTPAYMSPEQAGGESEVDGRSDVCALDRIRRTRLVGRDRVRARPERMLRQAVASLPPVTLQVAG